MITSENIYKDMYFLKIETNKRWIIKSFGVLGTQ